MILKIILKKLPDTILTSLYGNTESCLDICQIVLANDTLLEFYDEQILYLAPYSAELDQTYSGNLLFWNTPEHKKTGSNLYFHGTCSVSDLYLSFFHVLKDYQNFLRHKDMLTTAVSSTFSIPALLDMAYEYLQNPVILLNIGYEICAASPAFVSNGSTTEWNLENFVLSKDTIRTFEQEHIPEFIKEKRQAFHMYSDKRKSNMIFCSIRIGHFIPYFLYIREENCTFRSFDLEYISFLGEMIRIELHKTEQLKKAPIQTQGLFLHKLLSGKQDDYINTIMELQSYGVKDSNCFSVLILACNNITNANIASAYVTQITGIISRSISTFYNGYVVSLLSESLSGKDELRLRHFINYNKCRACMSVSFRNILHAPDYFQQAVCLLKQFEPSLKDSFLQCSDYLPELLFSSSNHLPDLFTLIHPDIKKLQTYDITYHTEYLNTLSTWLKHMRNQNQTAQALHVHKSTVSYRLLKIADLLSSDLTDGKLLFSYELSFHILNYLS